MVMSRDEIFFSGLLSEIENYCDVTWSDPVTDKKYVGMIASGIRYLDKRAGAELDYLNDEEALGLLKDYVRYMRDGAQDVFENNYLHLLLSMQNERKVNVYAGTEAPISPVE